MITVFSRALTSELTKLLSLRTVPVTLVLTVVLPALYVATTVSTTREMLVTDPSMLGGGVVPETVGLGLANLAVVGFIVLGVLAGSSESVGGQLRTSLVAVPRRSVLVSAKAAALTVVAIGVSVPVVASTSLLSQLMLGSTGAIDGGVPPSLILRWLGVVVFLAGMALISMSIALVARSGFVPMIALIVVMQGGVMLLVLTTAAKYLPTIAGMQMFDRGMFAEEFPGALLSTGQAYAIFLAWVAVLLGGAVWTVRRRDLSR